jgi:hypothetical protein
MKHENCILSLIHQAPHRMPGQSLSTEEQTAGANPPLTVTMDPMTSCICLISTDCLVTVDIKSPLPVSWDYRSHSIRLPFTTKGVRRETQIPHNGVYQKRLSSWERLPKYEK